MAKTGRNHEIIIITCLARIEQIENINEQQWDGKISLTFGYNKTGNAKILTTIII